MQIGIKKVVKRTKGKEMSVDAHLVDEAVAEPALFLDKLKGGRGRIKLRIGIKRQEKDDHGRAERGAARVFQAWLRHHRVGQG